MVAGDDLHRALWHREPVFRYDARRCVQHSRCVSFPAGGERGHDRLCVRTRRARGLLDALCVRQADGQDEALLADDDLRLSSRCTGRSRIGARRRARLDVGLRSAHHSAHGQGHQKAGKGHDHVLRRLAGGRGQELRHSGGTRPDRCVRRPGAALPRDALSDRRHDLCGLFPLLCRACHSGGDHDPAAAFHAHEVPESRTL